MFMPTQAVQNAKGYEERTKDHLFITRMRNQHIYDGIHENAEKNQK